MEEKFNEVWRVIEDNPDYEVSNLGRVRSKETKVLKEIHVYERAKSKYRVTMVNVGSASGQLSRVVAKAFPDICGDWFEGCDVHHKDKNPENNHADNLVVCTKEEHFEYHREDRTNRMLGDGNPTKGRKRTEEERHKISVELKGKYAGEKAYWYNKHHSDETKKKISNYNKGRQVKEKNPFWGKRHTAESRAKMSKSHEHEKKPVYQFSLDGEFIREWESCMDVKRELGFDNSDIARCCKGKKKTCHGFLWRFKNTEQIKKSGS